MTAFQLLAHQAKTIAKLEVDSKRLERALEMGGELYRHDIAQLQLDNAKLREALYSAIESTDDYDMIDRSNGKQYFKHEIFKRELKALEETK